MRKNAGSTAEKYQETLQTAGLIPIMRFACKRTSMNEMVNN